MSLKFSAKIKYIKSPDLIVCSSSDYIIVKSNEFSLEFDAKALISINKVLALLQAPTSGASINKKLSKEKSELKEIATIFLEHNFIVPNQTTKKGKETSLMCDHLVIGITGSLMAINMPGFALRLLNSGFCKNISIILTKSAQRFITRHAFEAYGMKVWENTFDYDEKTNGPIHMQLSTADMILVMPATADCLHRLANGSCSDLLTLTVLATRSAVVVSPFTNINLLEHPAVQRNLQQVRADGAYILEPEPIAAAIDYLKNKSYLNNGSGIDPRNYHKVPLILADILKAHKRKNAASK